MAEQLTVWKKLTKITNIELALKLVPLVNLNPVVNVANTLCLYIYNFIKVLMLLRVCINVYYKTWRNIYGIWKWCASMEWTPS